MLKQHVLAMACGWGCMKHNLIQHSDMIDHKRRVTVNQQLSYFTLICNLATGLHQLQQQTSWELLTIFEFGTIHSTFCAVLTFFVAIYWTPTKRGYNQSVAACSSHFQWHWWNHIFHRTIVVEPQQNQYWVFGIVDTSVTPAWGWSVQYQTVLLQHCCQ